MNLEEEENRDKTGDRHLFACDPTGPLKGPCNRRWMIQENLPEKVEP